MHILGNESTPILPKDSPAENAVRVFPGASVSDSINRVPTGNVNMKEMYFAMFANKQHQRGVSQKVILA
jgi:hypothetical protein